MRLQLFSMQRYLQRRYDVILPPERAKGRREWVISRGLCHYRCFALSDIPLNRREPVLQLQIQQWSPFTEYGSYIVWQGEQAQVWIWDKVIQQNRWLEMGINKATLLPETILQICPTTETTTQLLQCIEGYEGQIWQQGVLVGSRWWLNKPNAAEWLFFQRAQGLTTHSPLPLAIEAPLLNRPWGRTPNRFNKFSWLYKESTWITLSLAIITVILTWQTISIIKWQRSVNQIQQQIETFNEQVTPILSARTQAIANRQRFEQILALSTAHPLQLKLMATVAEKLSENQVRFINWSYQLKDLRFTIEADEAIDPTKYIKTFQSLPFLTEVKVDTFTDPKKLVLKMRVEPNQL